MNDVASPIDLHILSWLPNIQYIAFDFSERKSMNMNYRRAWQLVDTMNQCFQSALVETQTAKALEHNFQELSSYLKSPK